MNFASLDFAIFLLCVFALHWLLSHRWRWLLLLVASYFFYMCWRWQYAFLIFITTGVTFATSHLIVSSHGQHARRGWLLTGVIVPLSLLFWFKYFNLFGETLNAVLGLLGNGQQVPVLDILLPVGISFFTFQALSYLVDVYRERVQPEPHFGYYALYVAFFPQLVAGPIERPDNLIPQLRHPRKLSYAAFREGNLLILWGLFKKIVVADRLAVYVDAVYGQAGNLQGAPLLLATVFFGFQIYCDFSGYTDIARGTGRLLGVNLMENFRRPYFARNMQDFWRRWHISLSTWFRDYLFIPLGGSRGGRVHIALNVLIVFVVSGLWHGAAWTFVVWGAMHGLLLIVNRAVAGRWGRITAAWRGMPAMAITFGVAMLSWIPFRASSLMESWIITRDIFRFRLDGWNLNVGELHPNELLIAFGVIGVLLFVDAMQEWGGLGRRLHRLNTPLRWSVYIFAVLLTLVLGRHESNIQFIYFQF